MGLSITFTDKAVQVPPSEYARYECPEDDASIYRITALDQENYPWATPALNGNLVDADGSVFFDMGNRAHRLQPGGMWNRYREMLSTFYMGEYPPVVWKNPEKHMDSPFFTVVNFTDNYGILSAEAVQTLSGDFRRMIDRGWEDKFTDWMITHSRQAWWSESYIDLNADFRHGVLSSAEMGGGAIFA